MDNFPTKRGLLRKGVSTGVKNLQKKLSADRTPAKPLGKPGAESETDGYPELEKPANGKGGQANPTPNARTLAERREAARVNAEKDLPRRAWLEEEILCTIGGESGMINLWNSLCLRARGGRLLRFVSDANSFLMRGQVLEQYYNELQDIIQRSEESREYLPKDKYIRLTSPSQYDDECRRMLAYREKLWNPNIHYDCKIRTDAELSQWCQEIFQVESGLLDVEMKEEPTENTADMTVPKVHLSEKTEESQNEE